MKNSNLLLAVVSLIFVVGCQSSIDFDELPAVLGSEDLGKSGNNDSQAGDGSNTVNPIGATEPNGADNTSGNAGVASTVTFFQANTKKKLDLLVVTDNSGSMANNQEKLSRSFQSLVNHLDLVDWQIAVTTTDVSSGQFSTRGSLLELEESRGSKIGEYIIRSTTARADQKFTLAVQRPEAEPSCYGATYNCGHFDEQPLLASLLTFRSPRVHDLGFYRPDADVAVLVLSDEDEFGDGRAEATKADQFLAQFKSVFGDEKKLIVSGVVIKPGDKDCFDQQSAQKVGTAPPAYATHVAELSQMTQGRLYSICESNYTRAMKDFANQLSNLVNSFDLPEMPKKDGFKVKLTPAQPHIVSVLEGKRIIFSEPPQHGTKIEVTFYKLAN